MQVDGQGGGLLQSLHQLLRRIGGQKSGHVLDAQGVSSHLLDLFCNLFPVVQGVGVAQGIAQGDLHMGFLLVGRLHRRLQVADVVEAVEDADDVDAVGHGFLHEILHHIVGVVVVSQDILAAEQHLQLGVLKSVSQLSQALPGIFL